MAITLNLAPEEENLVRQKARAQGREAENYVAELVLRDINPLAESAAEPPARSLAEMLHGRVGLFENEGVSYVAQGPPSLEVLEGLIGVLESNCPDLAASSEEEFGESLVEEYRAQGLTFRDRK